MANPEHLARLKEAARVQEIESWNGWNEWRERNQDIQPDLSGADLSGTNLSHFNLREANLIEAFLIKTVLIGANLYKANLSRAYLNEAKLHEANLGETKFIRANLGKASLQRANLYRANFSRDKLSNRGADLRETDLSQAFLKLANLSFTNLSFANLNAANLEEANLEGANLYRAGLYKAFLYKSNLKHVELRRAYLKGSVLCSTNLSHANLYGANLVEADLSKADLSNASLTATQLMRSNLTLSLLTGACIQDWNINDETQLNNVICDYVYLKDEWSLEEGKSHFSDRRPIDLNNNFAPGEFTKLFQKILETVDLIFIDGIDWNAFFQSFQELRSQYNNEDLTIQAIEKKPGGAFVVRIETPPEANKALIESQVKKLYGQKLQLLEAQYRAKLHAKEREIESYKRENTNMMEIARLLASKPITVEQTNVSGDQFNNNIQNSTIANFANQVRDNASQNASQFSQTIGRNADDIAKLIAALREQVQQFPTEQHDDLRMGIDDLERDLTTPDTVKPNRIKRRLIALFSALHFAATPVATGTDFVNNVLDLADKFGIPATELIQHVPPRLLL